MKLVPINEYPDAAQILFDLLAERTPEQSISHGDMPVWEDHLVFVESHDPANEMLGCYIDWCLLECAEGIAGSIYLTEANEIGLSIFKKYQRQSYGRTAVAYFLKKHGERTYFANVAPANEASKAFWRGLGFGLLQEVYSLEPPDENS